MPQIEKPDDLHLIANLIRFFWVCTTIASVMEISPKEAGGKFDRELVRTDSADYAFGIVTVVYGQIDEKGHAVRKRPARKMPITDKIGKNGLLSVRFQTFRIRFYGQMLRKAAFVLKICMRFCLDQLCSTVFKKYRTNSIENRPFVRYFIYFK